MEKQPQGEEKESIISRIVPKITPAPQIEVDEKKEIKKLSDNQIQLASDEANLLLEYAVQKGIKIDDSIYEIVTHAKYLSREGRWTKEMEPVFWKAYQTLSVAVQPASISSLKSAKNEFGRQMAWYMNVITLFSRKGKISHSRRAILGYRASAVIILLIILIAQIYSFTGTALTAESNQLRGQLDSLLRQNWTLPYDSASLADEKIRAKADLLAYDLMMTQTMMDANFKYMAAWQQRWGRIFSLGLYESKALDTLKNTSVIIKEMNTYSANELKNIARLTYSVSFPLQVVNMYILPMLYGLLGACAFVLREIAKEVQMMTFTTEDVVNYNLRIQLGALAGLVIGWFLIPGETQTSMAFSVYNLGPYALAFMGGYSIELLFSAMDRFIGAFSNRQVGEEKK